MHVTKDVLLIEGMGSDSNIYVIDGEMIVDTGTGATFQTIKNKIDNEYDVDRLKTIINTHCHFDHTGGDKKFRDWLNAEIMIHEKDRKSLESGVDTLAEMFGHEAKSTTVDKTLRNKGVIKTTNFKFTVLHTPGHTPGSISLYEKDKKILISGDTIFADGIGRTDLPGGSNIHLMESLNKLLDYPAYYLLPGHGFPKVGNINFLIKQMLVKHKPLEKV